MCFGGFVVDGLIEWILSGEFFFFVIDGDSVVVVCVNVVLLVMFCEGIGVVFEGIMVIDGVFEMIKFMVKYDNEY